MLEGVLGNRTAEKVLLFLEQYEEGYAKEISDTFPDVSLSMAQGQLQRLETGAVLVSVKKGRTRLFTWNPRFAFRKELRAMLAKALDALPEEQRQRYFMKRRRPRRTGKPD